MAKAFLKELRNVFRNRVFERDRWMCRVCGRKAIDAHHITSRDDMPNGGYVVENGISLCSKCHLAAESHICDDEGLYSPGALYILIDSSYEKAHEASRLIRMGIIG